MVGILRLLAIGLTYVLIYRGVKFVLGVFGGHRWVPSLECGLAHQL